MIVYIAGPMTGVEKFNFPLFFATADRLTRDGHTPINPATSCGATLARALETAGDEPYEWYLRRAVRRLTEAEAVCVLPGWRRSRGASLEVHIAESLKMPILRYGPDGLGPVPNGGGVSGQMAIGGVS